MDYKLLPIGTVITVKQMQAVVVGYEWQKKEDRLALAYVIVPYPMGFTKNKDLKVTGSDEFEVLQSGFTGGGYPYLAKFYDKITELAAEMPYEKMVGYLNDATRILQEGAQ